MPYVTFVYVLTSCLHSFQTHHQRRRVVVGDHHLDVVDHHLVLQLLVYLIYTEKKMVLMIHQDVVQNLDHQMQDVMYLDAQQNLGAQNLDVIPPFLDVVHRFLVNLQLVAEDVELRYQLKMDCFLDVVDVELLDQLKMDCFLDVVPAQMALLLK
jgi:hypothetical protein